MKERLLVLLTSKRFYGAAIMLVSMAIYAVWGIEVDEATQAVTVNKAVTIGTYVSEALGFLWIIWTKYHDSSKK